jgi:hypothetical protein
MFRETYDSRLADMLAGAARRQIFYWCARKSRLLPVDLSGTYRERKKLPLLCQRGRCRGSWISTLPTLPA